jgi:hypothetical protein
MKSSPEVPITSFGRFVVSLRGFGVVTVHVTYNLFFATSCL